jgi:fructuronate reductase/mannitol 2-dehydrogenase
MADSHLRAYVEQLMRLEIAPLLPRVAGFDVAAYRRSVLERLANPGMRDQLARLCRSGSLKLPQHVLPSIVAARRQGLPHELLTLAVAGWCRYLRGHDDDGERLAIDDPDAERLRALAEAGPRALLRDRAVFGQLAADDGFVSAAAHAIWRLDRVGARDGVAAALGIQRVAA